VLLPVATILVVIGLALLPLLGPWFIHPALDAAQAPAWLGVDEPQARAWSDETVRELVLGPGSFAIPGPGGAPLFGPDEVAHLRDARVLLWLALGAAAVSGAALAARLLAGIDRLGTWRGIGRGGALAAIGALVVGLVGLVAFDPLFELFHRLFFPGGGWAFDARTSVLVRLYPFAFWELAALGLGIGVVLLGCGAWLVARAAAQGGRRP
jgi:hypothetical protein